MSFSRAALVILLLRVTTAMFGLGAIGLPRAGAQEGVIGFLDICNTGSRAYVMRGRAESASNPRVLLPELFDRPLDISTTGPAVTVLQQGLVATQVNDVGGNLVPDAPVSTRLPDDPDDPDDLPTGTNSSRFVRFSPLGDRVAIVTGRGVLVIADIVRENGKITGLTNPTTENLLTIGSPSDSSISAPLAGFPDFSQDGTQIVVSIYYDLWLLTLDIDGHTVVSAEPLTRTVGDAEWQAVFSPDGRIAFVGANSKGKAGPDSRNPILYTLDLDTREITQVTPSNAVVGLRDPAWSPDGQSLAFIAAGPRAHRRTDDCGSHANYDVFLIDADGTGTPAQLTTSVGTGVEMHAEWGW